MRRRRQALAMLLLLCVAVAAASIAGVSGQRRVVEQQPRALLFPTDGVAGSDRGDSAPGTGRIINGTKAPALTNESRWRSASFLLHYDYDRGRSWSCGGTFVTARHVVTAAHCVADAGVLVPANTLFVTSGRSSIADIMGALRGGKRPTEVPGLIPVRAATMHPAYADRTYANDVAVVEASSDAGLQPTPLVGASEQGAWGGGNGRPLAGEASPAIAGWGNTAYSGAPRMSEDLLEGRIPIISDAKCSEMIGASFTPSNMLCGSVLDTDADAATTNGVDSCQGDSGGPLLAPVADGSMRLVGITSWGGVCGSAYQPGAYTRIDSVRAWIEGITGPASGTTNMPAAAEVAGGGGGGGGVEAAGGAFRMTAPKTGARIGSTGSTTVTWLLPSGVVATEVTLDPDVGAMVRIPVAAGARSVQVPNSKFRRGSTYMCVESVLERDRGFYASSCARVTKGAQFAAGITSAMLRGGKLTMRGRVAASVRTVRVAVKATAGGRTVRAKARPYTVPAYPRSRSFSVTVPWSGAAPRSLTTTTVVSGGGERRTFRSKLR